MTLRMERGLDPAIHAFSATSLQGVGNLVMSECRVAAGVALAPPLGCATLQQIRRNGTIGVRMSEINVRYSVNRAHVVHEIFEDEVLVVNLDSGVYFSLLGASARIWQCILAGASFDDIVQSLGAAYDGEASIITATTLDFIRELGDEKLIVAAAETGPAALPAAPAARKPFEPPRLQKFTDMQELLLLDPVHDVEDVGWPVAKPLTPPGA